MISTIDLRGRTLGVRELRQLLPRAEFDVAAAVETVRPICEDVRHRGAAALYDLASASTASGRPALRVPADVLERALDRARPAGARGPRGVRSDAPGSSTRSSAAPTPRRHVVPGGTVTERWVPVDRVGLYVPGGLAVYPSSVVMNVVPAQVAGVGSLAVASPPQRENSGDFTGYPHPTILAACALLGVDEVYAVGGAQAVAAFAYGFDRRVGRDGATVSCEPVSLVTGPGNIYVAAAKRHLKGVIGIDAEAGPDRDRDPRRRHRRRRPTSRPTW